ncbi:MFS transporter [Streptomyces althioticus]|uniref:MFS transporter n=1 Tax=Streptomyces althioticus TaxID=83380 RepID=UPI00367CA1FD
MAVALWTSACPTMTYPLYQADWGISTTTVTWVFAAYPLTLIPVLLLLGHLADHLGARVTMLLGLVAQFAGVLLFAVADGVPWLLAGRALSPAPCCPSSPGASRSPRSWAGACTSGCSCCSERWGPSPRCGCSS